MSHLKWSIEISSLFSFDLCTLCLFDCVVDKVFFCAWIWRKKVKFQSRVTKASYLKKAISVHHRKHRLEAWNLINIANCNSNLLPVGVRTQKLCALKIIFIISMLRRHWALHGYAQCTHTVGGKRVCSVRVYIVDGMCIQLVNCGAHNHPNKLEDKRQLFILNEAKRRCANLDSFLATARVTVRSIWNQVMLE